MKIDQIQPIPEKPVLHIKDKKTLILADLHIGIEHELRMQGLNPINQTKKMQDEILNIIKDTNSETIFLLGDIKHNVPSSTKEERYDVKDFLKNISKYCTVHIIPGNHDGNIKYLINKDMNLHSSEGFILENVALVHGHRWPKKEIFQCEQIIMSHTHPTIVLTDRLDHKTFEPCWVKASFIDNKLKEKYPDSKSPEILIVPPFNPLCGGVALNKEGIMGPLGKIIDVNNSEIFLLDSTSMGKVKNIK